MASASPPQAPRSSRSRVLRTLRAQSMFPRNPLSENPRRILTLYAASTSERRSPSCTVPSARLEDQRLELSGARSPVLTVCRIPHSREAQPERNGGERVQETKQALTHECFRKLRCSTRTVPPQPPTKVVRCVRQSHVVPILDIKTG